MRLIYQYIVRLKYSKGKPQVPLKKQNETKSLSRTTCDKPDKVALRANVAFSCIKLGTPRKKAKMVPGWQYS